jgi:hypothetical protein
VGRNWGRTVGGISHNLSHWFFSSGVTS